METGNELEQEIYEFEDPATGKAVKLPLQVGDVNIKSLIENVIARSNAKAKKQYREEIETMKSRLMDFEETKSRLEELETKTLPAAEKEKREIEKIRQEAIKYKSESENILSALASEKLNNSIYKAAIKHPEIVDTSITTDLFMARCAPKMRNEGGEYKAVANIDGEEMDVVTGFSRWLQKPENKILLKNNLNPGGGSAPNANSNNQGRTITREQFNSMSFAERNEAMKSGAVLTD